MKNDIKKTKSKIQEKNQNDQDNKNKSNHQENLKLKTDSNDILNQNQHEKIKKELEKYNIDLDLDYEDDYETFLLKNSLKHKVLLSLYNKLYPYDLELNKNLNIPLNLIDYKIENRFKNFVGLKFNKKIINIDKFILEKDCFIKGLMVDIKYNINPYLNFLNKIKIDFDFRFLTDNINHIYVVINNNICDYKNVKKVRHVNMDEKIEKDLENTDHVNDNKESDVNAQKSANTINCKNILNSHIESKIMLYELQKHTKGHLKENYVTTGKYKLQICSTKFLIDFYDRYFTTTSQNISVSEISFCIREYLDRNGFLVYFNINLIDFISYIIYLQNKNMYTTINVLRLFLQFKFHGTVLNINKEEYNFTNDNFILVLLNGVKFIERYPDAEIINRLKLLNDKVYQQFYLNVGTAYNKFVGINDMLSFVHYGDYDVVLSHKHIHESKKIEYKDKKGENVFDFIDKRCFMIYSRANDMLFIKYKKEFNFDFFILYLLSISNFCYIKFNK